MSQNISQSIEALLFIQGESLALTALQKILGVDKNLLQEALQNYSAELVKRGGALVLVQDTKNVRLAVKTEHQALLESLAKSELQENLSKAALETLALVAYLAPVSRAEIDAIRGVNSSFSLRNLSLRGLVTREGNPRDARGYVYSPSMDFLVTLGLQSVEDLPQYKKLREDERLLVLQGRASSDDTHKTNDETTHEKA
jgi:segregation and condensation protein B